MLVRLPCGCAVDDAVMDSTHREPPHDGASTGDAEREGHWPIGAGPSTYCKHCDLFRPCGCDRAAA